VRTRLKSLLLDGNWSALLEAAEEVMATPFGRGWLDLQRYVGTALEGLGTEYQPVRSLVLDALGGLLRDLPSLPDQTLMDDSPTANRQTREWLAAEGVWGDGEAVDGSSAAPAPTVGDGLSLASLVQQARRTARSDPSRAVEMLLRAAERAGHPRDSFLHRSEAAAIMLDHGLDSVALPILDDILQLIDAHALESWEAGATLARPLGLLYKVRTAAGENADDLYERICRLDPVQAVRFQTVETAADETAAAAEDVEL
jgi:type VI secretion system protein ImpA